MKTLFRRGGKDLKLEKKGNTEMHHYKKRNLLVVMILVLIIGVNSIQLNASDNYKRLEVVIGEGSIDNPNLSKRVDIPKLKDVSVESVSNGGTARLEVTGTQVNVLATGGKPTRKVDNPSKRTEQVTEIRTSSNNNFQNTIQVSSGGINVTLSKNGASKVISGVYTPGDSKYVENQSSANYNSGGYSGRLDSYLYSGTYTPSESRAEEVIRTIGFTSDNTYEWDSGTNSWTFKGNEIGIGDLPTTYRYNIYGFTGTLNIDVAETEKDIRSALWGGRGRPNRDGLYHGEIINPPTHLNVTYKGTVTKPASDTRVYRYRGTVTKPSTDTRVWEQQYQGTKHIPGVDNYYSYTVVLKYLVNTKPIISFTTTPPTTYVNNDSVINVEGMVTDPDNQTIKIHGTISGIKKETVLEGPLDKGDWKITWTGEELKEGIYKDIPFTVTDGDEESVEVFKGSIVVDKKNPTITITVE